MKNILFVLHGSNKDSGATKSLLDIIDKLQELNKYKIYVIIPDHKGNVKEYLEKKNIDVFIYKYGDLYQSLSTPLIKRMLKIPIFIYRRIRVQVNAQKAYKKFKSMKIDIVFTNTITVMFGAILAKKLNAKNIWSIREFGLLDHNIKYFLGENHIEKYIQKNSDAVLCVSDAVRKYHSKNIDRKKMYVIYNSYPKSFIYKKQKYNLKNKLEILVAGDIKPGKGQYDVVKALKQLIDKYPNSATLHLAGRITNPKYGNLIKKYIKENKIEDKVVFYGQVSNMLELRKKMDIGIVSSQNEAFGRTMIEGMLCSMCMIGRNTGGTVEQIIDKENGLLYNGDEIDLFKKLEKVYNDRNLMKKLAESGFQKSVEQYTNGYSAKMCEMIIDRIIEKEK